MILFVIFILFVGGGWLIGKVLGNVLFPKEENEYQLQNTKETSTVINNYTTENHLHISKEELKSLMK